MDLATANAAIQGFAGLKGLDLAQVVTVSKSYEWTETLGFATWTHSS